MENPLETAHGDARIWARTGVLAAFALVLSYVETFIPLPVPIPGAKIGLANIPIIMALVLLDGKSAFIIALIKTIVVGLLFGSPIMIPYSAAGTFAALAVMWALVRVPGLHLVLVSMIGSLFHIAGQLAAATVLLGTVLVWYTFPLLMVIAYLAGAATGWAAGRLLRALEDARKEPQRAGALADADIPLEEKSSAPAAMRGLPVSVVAESPLQRVLARLDARWLLVGFALYIAGTLCASGPTALAICVALALLASLSARLRLRDAFKALLPLLSILVVTTIAQVLYQQQGTVLFSIGAVHVTDRAVATVATMFVRLLCIMAMSVAFMRAVPFEDLSDALLRLLAPLAKLGVRVDALALALDVALRSVPVLMADFESLKAAQRATDPAFGTGGLFAKLRAYLSLIGPLTVRAFAYADALAADTAEEEELAEGELAAVAVIG